MLTTEEFIARIEAVFGKVKVLTDAEWERIAGKNEERVLPFDKIVTESPHIGKSFDLKFKSYAKNEKYYKKKFHQAKRKYPPQGTLPQLNRTTNLVTKGRKYMNAKTTMEDILNEDIEKRLRLPDDYPTIKAVGDSVISQNHQPLINTLPVGNNTYVDMLRENYILQDDIKPNIAQVPLPQPIKSEVAEKYLKEIKQILIQSKKKRII